MDQVHVDANDFGVDPDKKVSFPHITVLTNDQYRSLTEDGVVKMIEDGIYTYFDKEANPTDLLKFANWQIDKLPRETAKYLWDYIYWGLKAERPNHKYKAQWEAFLSALKGYIDEHQALYDERQTIERVFPAEGNRVYCLCRDGKFRIYDATWLVEKGTGAFAYFKDPAFFRDCIGVINDTLAWEGHRKWR